MKYIVVFVSLFVLGGCGILGTLHSNETYQNPIGEMTDIGDPYVLKVEDTYYMYATSAGSIGFIVWESENLVDWEQVGLAYDHSDQVDQWAQGDFWAPEVIEKDGTYFMVYSARAENDELTMSLATSDSPTGPFQDQVVDIIDRDGSYIDGHIFIDDDETPYLYYVRDNYDNFIGDQQISQIYVQEMAEDLLSLVGEPTMVIEPNQEWEGLDGDIVWNEGPFIVKNEGLYYLMYSANFYGGPHYSIGYAVSESPLGPFEKYEENPILAADLSKGVSGPGHNSVTVGLDDETLYAVYHIHTDPENPSGNRRPAMDRLYFEDGIMKIDGPTMDEQELR